MEEIQQLNYPDIIRDSESHRLFIKIHELPWEEFQNITPGFRIKKTRYDLRELYLPEEYFNIIYYDAFAPSAQPFLWTDDVFNKLYQCLIHQGILVTYCSKGDVRRSLERSGFIVEKMQGPPGKREMLRAKRP